MLLEYSVSRSNQYTAWKHLTTISRPYDDYGDHTLFATKLICLFFLLLQYAKSNNFLQRSEENHKDNILLTDWNSCVILPCYHSIVSAYQQKSVEDHKECWHLYFSWIVFASTCVSIHFSQCIVAIQGGHCCSSSRQHILLVLLPSRICLFSLKVYVQGRTLFVQSTAAFETLVIK